MMLARIFFNLLFWLGVRFLFILFAVLAFPFSLFPGGKRAFYLVCRYVLRAFFWCLFTRVRVSGAERLPGDRSLLFISDRTRRLFPLYFIAFFPLPLRFVAAEGILRVPFVGRVVRMLGAISYPRDEEDKKKSWIFGGTLYSALHKREPVLIFYENLKGRSRKRAERRKRVVEIARSCGADIVPVYVATRGAGNGDHRDVFLLGEVEIEIGEPLAAAPGENSGETGEKIKGFFEGPEGAS